MKAGRWRVIFHPPVCLLNSCNIWCWISLKTGTQSLIQVSHTGGRNSSNLTITCFRPKWVSQMASFHCTRLLYWRLCFKRRVLLNFGWSLFHVHLSILLSEAACRRGLPVSCQEWKTCFPHSIGLDVRRRRRAGWVSRLAHMEGNLSGSPRKERFGLHTPQLVARRPPKQWSNSKLPHTGHAWPDSSIPVRTSPWLQVTRPARQTDSAWFWWAKTPKPLSQSLKSRLAV